MTHQFAISLTGLDFNGLPEEDWNELKMSTGITNETKHSYVENKHPQTKHGS